MQALLLFLVVVLFPSALASRTSSRLLIKAIIPISSFLYSEQSYAIPAIDAALRANSITYSTNAKNFARIGEGDYSMGSRNTSTSPAAQKRNAVAACKKPDVLKALSISEKECYMKTMTGDIEFMQQFLSRQSQ